MPEDYRSRIYGQYVSAFKGHQAADAELPAFRRQFHIYDNYFRGITQRDLPTQALEIGCGPGSLLYWARERGWPQLTGLDLSAEQVAVAQALGLDARQMRVQDFLAGQREAYDLIIGMDVIEHLTRDEALHCLDLCATALKSGGTLFLTTPNGAGLRPGPIAYGDLTHETIFTPQTMRTVLQLTGFQDIKISEVVPLPTSLASRVRGLLWRAIRSYALLLDLVEKGASACEGVYSRVMVIEARKP